MRTGLVVEGGGMRGIYSSGVLDYFLEQEFSFEYCIGTSAGSANLASFLGGQYKRTYRFYHEYGQDKRFLGLYSYLTTGQYFGLDYMYDEISSRSGKDPLNFQRILKNPSRLEMTATNAETGRPHYFRKEEMKQNCYDILKASCAIPGLCRPIVIDGVPYVDGGVSDPIPIQRAFDSGCDQAVVILASSWPKEEKKESAQTESFLRRKLKAYPNLLHSMERNAEIHDLEHRLAFSYEKMGKALILMPENDSYMNSQTRNRKQLEKFYRQGYTDAQSAGDLIRKMLQE